METIFRRLTQWATRLYGANLPLRRPERNPLEFSLCFVILLANARTAIGLQALPPSLAKAPAVFGQICITGMVLGAFAIMVALAWPSRDARLVIEQAGLTLLGLGLLGYGVALIYSGSTWASAAVATSLAVGLALGTAVRYLQIWWYFRRQRAILNTPAPVLNTPELGGAP